MSMMSDQSLSLREREIELMIQNFLRTATVGSTYPAAAAAATGAWNGQQPNYAAKAATKAADRLDADQAHRVPWLVELRAFCNDASVVGLRYVQWTRTEVAALDSVQSDVEAIVAEEKARLSTDALRERQVTARSVQPRLTPMEAWTSPDDDQRQEAIMEKITNQRKKRRGKRSLWLMSVKRFCYEASVVGLRYVANASASPFRRSIWVMLLLVGAAFTTFQIQDRIVYFLSRPVNVNLRMEHAKEIRFPTVTVCNENRITYSSAAYFGKHRNTFLIVEICAEISK